MTDPYVKNYIEQKKESSSLMNAKCAVTLDREGVQILRPGVNGIAVLRQPAGVYIAVHSAGGNPEIRDMRAYTASMFERLIAQAEAIGARPIAFADVLDANNDTKELVTLVADQLVESANKHGLSIMNGETARLGARMACEANLTGTMISVSKDELPLGSFTRHGTVYGVFRSDGRAIYINSDGVGTKTEFYERLRTFVPDAEERAIDDKLAMDMDDLAKIGGIARVNSTLCEYKGNINLEAIARRAERRGKEMDFIAIIQPENVGSRLRGYNDETASYNLSGSTVSVIDEDRLNNPLKPQAGEYLVAIRGKPNPRSNGISDNRKAMVEMLGPDWHEIPMGKLFLDYLAEPSTILYPIIQDLVNRDLATFFMHNSGGAWKDKVAKPLANHGLFIRMENLFQPDPRNGMIGLALKTLPEDVFRKWPNGTEGYVSTVRPIETIRAIESHGLQGRNIGLLLKAESEHGIGEPRTGIELAGIKGSNGKDIYFSGRD